MGKISDSLNERIKEKHGISSADVDEMVEKTQRELREAEGKKTGASVTASSEVEVERPESNDNTAAAAAEELDRKNFFFGLAGAGSMYRSITISPDDKQRFIEAVLSNSRMTADFSFFGGKMNFKIRNRTYEEARAAMHFASEESRKTTESRTGFSMRLRSMLLALQVAEFNGVAYAPAQEDGSLFSVYEGGTIVRPKWLERTQIYEALPEAVFEAVWQCLYEFEAKYWTLVRNSRNQDFWRPE
jgi:hypothetical protein